VPSFTPPTVDLGSGDSFFGRYSVAVGQSVVRVNGTFQTTPYPWIGELTGVEGTDWFLGGHTYQVTEAIATELVAAGFTVTRLGFGEGPFGSDPFGGSA
jgi:hypothetical protein